MRKSLAFTVALFGFLLTGSVSAQPRQERIVHDAEFYVLEAQNGKRWAAEDEKLSDRLAELRKKHGTPPNIVHIMWDDTAYGDVGIPAIQMVRGLKTPNLNQMAREGILFTRMYTEVGCTPSRAACMTGRNKGFAVRPWSKAIGCGSSPAAAKSCAPTPKVFMTTRTTDPLRMKRKQKKTKPTPFGCTT